MSERLDAYRPCAADGCESRGEARGFCNRHYLRWIKYGSTELPRRPTVQEQFEARVRRDGTIPAHRPDLGPCWIWIGGRHSQGYGTFKGQLAHRASYEMHRGPIPVSLELDHLCRNRRCVNPDHLEPVTHTENVNRGEAPNAVTKRTGICQHGHKLEGENLYIVPRTGVHRCRLCTILRCRRWRREKAAA